MLRSAVPHELKKQHANDTRRKSLNSSLIRHESIAKSNRLEVSGARLRHAQAVSSKKPMRMFANSKCFITGSGSSRFLRSISNLGQLAFTHQLVEIVQSHMRLVTFAFCRVSTASNAIMLQKTHQHISACLFPSCTTSV